MKIKKNAPLSVVLPTTESQVQGNERLVCLWSVRSGADMRQAIGSSEASIDLLHERLTSTPPLTEFPLPRQFPVNQQTLLKHGPITPSVSESTSSVASAHDFPVETGFIAPATEPIDHGGLTHQENGGSAFVEASSETSHGNNGTQSDSDSLAFDSANSTNFGPASDLVHFGQNQDLIHAHDGLFDQTNMSDSNSATSSELSTTPLLKRR